ncbi:MAG: glycosyltransferase family 2 protein [Bacteroidia bacterium]|nr:glycosyltransferase family 2 protein [Bacteroidia bacterium]MCZ2248522.1 glycosyltransferase family 2 protein [Bacteroidia bacterium]
MISIITAVHNQLAMNRLFVRNLQKYSKHPFELVIIDNASSDGSAEFFESCGATVIRNAKNYSYPYTQNQGIKAAKGNVFAFLNNDIIVCPNWDALLLESIRINQLDVLTSCGLEQVESKTSSDRLRRKWNYVKNFLNLFPTTEYSLKLMHSWMYNNWEKFCHERDLKFHNQIKEGFVGHSVFCTRRAIELLGLWDERIQSADFDIYMRSKKRSLEYGDIKPCHIALNIYHHHYIRLTTKKNPQPFADAGNLIKFDAKWSEAERKQLLKDIELF